MIRKFFIGLTLVVMTIFSGNAQKKSPIKKGAELTLVSDDYIFTEGPATDKNGNVYFTDQPNNRILKWDATTNKVSVFMENAGRSNGLYFDKDGSLYACADEKFELWKISPDKNVTVILDNYQDKKLNGPNDLWIDSKGGIYFTDPYYQRDWWTRTVPEQESKRVYYLTPDKKELKMVADGFVQPNGIIGSSDKGLLYIADIGDNKTYSYKIAADGSLTNKKLFTELGSDGMTLDNKENLYLTGDGVIVFNSKGEQIEHIKVDRKWTANVTFGGKNNSTLFITASEAVYTLEMKTHGVK